MLANQMRAMQQRVLNSALFQFRARLAPLSLSVRMVTNEPSKRARTRPGLSGAQEDGNTASPFDSSSFKTISQYSDQIGDNMTTMKSKTNKAAKGSKIDMGMEERTGDSDIDNDDWHSYEMRTFYDSDGNHVSHVRHTQRGKDGKETISEEQRFGDKRKLAHHTRNEKNAQWNSQSRTYNINDDEHSILEFDKSFDSVWGKPIVSEDGLKDAIRPDKFKNDSEK